jgi:nickel-dependent lactate racemase
MKIVLPYDQEGMEVSIVAENLHLIKPPPISDDLDPEPVRSALENPVGCPSFRDMIQDKKSLLIAVTDHHRKGTYQKEILHTLLQNLPQPLKAKTKVLIARGTHSPASREDWGDLYGQEAVKTCDFICHDPHDQENLTDSGRTEWGDPVLTNRWVQEADMVAAIGLLRPSARSGYSGGAKMFAVGTAGYPTIMSTHNASLYFHSRSVVGNFQNHPFHDRILAIARKAEEKSRAGKYFLINAVEQKGKIRRVFSGEMEAVWQEGCRFARERFEVAVPEPADILVCGGGAPSDHSPYAFTSLLNNAIRTNPRPLLKEGGVLIAPASLKKEPAAGSMDASFLSLVRNIPYEKSEQVVAEMEQEGKSAARDLEGIHRFLGVAALFQHTHGRIFVVGAQNPGIVSQLRFLSFETFDKALNRALEICGAGANILVIPQLNAISPYVGEPHP